MFFRSYKGWRQALRENGYVGQTNMATYRLLVDQGVKPGQMNQMWQEFLIGQGYTGHLQKMLHDFEAGGYAIGNITANTTITQNLFAGNVPADVNSAATDTDSYDSSAGTVTSAVLQKNGSNWTSGASDAFDSITVSVTDSEGNTQSFTIDGSVAQPTITVDSPLVMSALYAGQAIEDTANYATLTGTGNFSTNAGSISSTTVNAIGPSVGDGEDVTTAFGEGDEVGYEVVVTHSSGFTQTFQSNETTVQYKLRVNSVAGNEADIDVNPLVITAGDTVSIPISGFTGDKAAWNGTYVVNAAEFADTADVYTFPGTVLIAYDGDLADLGAGDTVRFIKGLHVINKGTFSLSSQAKYGTTNMGAADATSFELTATQEGTDLTLEVDAGDGTDTTSTTSAAISVPGSAGGDVAITRVATPAEGVRTGLDITSAPAGSVLFLTITGRDNAPDFSMTAATLNDGSGAVAMTKVVDTADITDTRMYSAIWRIARPAGNTVDIVSTWSESVGREDWAIYAVENYGSVGATAFGGVGGATSQDISLDTTNGGGLIVCGGTDANPATLTTTGVGNAVTETDGGGRTYLSAHDNIATGSTPRTVSVDSDVTGHMAAAAVAITKAV